MNEEIKHLLQEANNPIFLKALQRKPEPRIIRANPEEGKKHIKELKEIILTDKSFTMAQTKIRKGKELYTKRYYKKTRTYHTQETCRSCGRKENYYKTELNKSPCLNCESTDTHLRIRF